MGGQRIQSVGGQSGVRMQGMEFMANDQAEADNADAEIIGP